MFLSSIAFQERPHLSHSYTTSTIGCSLYLLHGNAIGIGLLLMASVPEVILDYIPLEDLMLNKFPYSTLALISCRLPSIFLIFAIPISLYEMEGKRFYKYKNIFKKSFLYKNICRTSDTIWDTWIFYLSKTCINVFQEKVNVRQDKKKRNIFESYFALTACETSGWLEGSLLFLRVWGRRFKSRCAFVLHYFWRTVLFSSHFVRHLV